MNPNDVEVVDDVVVDVVLVVVVLVVVVVVVVVVVDVIDDDDARYFLYFIAPSHFKSDFELRVRGLIFKKDFSPSS